MSQLQYIGARYVPVWYVNTDDNNSADWQPNVEYEPLTFVTTSNNHLYLSKKEVPDTIGNPANNMAYWLDMGVFTNAQIAALQQQVDDLELKVGDLDDLNTTDKDSVVDAINELVEVNDNEKPHIILVGDSYDAFGTSIFNQIISAYPDWDIKKTSIGGNSFSHALNTSKNSYKKSLQEMTLTDAEKAVVNRIIIMGGYNEIDDRSDIEAGVADTVSYIRNTFPNADIEFMPVGRDNSSTTEITLLSCMDRATRRLIELGCKVYDNARWILANRAYIGSDNVHPEGDGKTELVYYLKQVVAYKKLEVIRSFYTSISTPSGVTYSVSGDGGCIFSQVNDKVTIMIPYLHLTPNTGETGRVAIAAHASMTFVSTPTAGAIKLFGSMPTIDYPLNMNGELLLQWASGYQYMVVINNTNSTQYYGVNSGESESAARAITYEIDLHTSGFII